MIDLYDFIETLNEASLPTDIINPSFSGMQANVILQTWKVKQGQRFCTNFVLGEMGAGLGNSIGAALATGRRVIHLEGDGGFQLNIQELETIRRLNLPIVMFIINNDGYHSIRQSQLKNFGRLTGADSTSGFTTPSLEQIANAYGIGFAEPRLIDIKDGIGLDGPVLYEVKISPDQQYRNRTKNIFVNGEWKNA